ncbi:MAG: hemolysin III family protein [Candidatus Dormibacteria bacterium]
MAGLPLGLAFRPRLRGVLHQWTFVVSLLAGTLLIIRAGSAGARVAVSVYAFSLAACLGVSALYHRVPWSAVNKRRMQKVDHATIFLLIAGTFTPIAVIVLSPLLATITLLTVWSGAAVGIVMAVLWTDPPTLVEVGTYLLLGTLGLLLLPALLHDLGGGGVALLGAGGLLYWCGAMVYARHRPDPWPRTFGFHEIFHVFVVLAAGTHFAVIALVETR